MIKKYINKDKIVRMIAPQAAKIGANLIRSGFRVALRSSVQLMRANLITRIISCLTILVLDIRDLTKHRISVAQFIRNIIFSVLLVVFGVFGWNIGAQWFAIEIIGGIIGMLFMSTIPPYIIDKLVNKFVESDSHKMLSIIKNILNDYPIDEKKKKSILKNLTAVQLKKMYASEDREGYANTLIIDIIAKS
jgi:hypothetical protein